MKCRKVQKHIPAYLEHVLDPVSQDALTEHIRNCAVCQQELLSYQATLDLASTLEVEYPSEEEWASFLPNLYARIEAEEGAYLSPAWKSWLQPSGTRVAAAAGCLAIALLVITHIQNMSTKPTQNSQLSPMEVISATLINDVEARELIALDASSALDDPFTFQVDMLDMSSQLAPIELRFDLATLEETFRLPQDELWQVVAYMEH